MLQYSESEVLETWFIQQAKACLKLSSIEHVTLQCFIGRHFSLPPDKVFGRLLILFLANQPESIPAILLAI
jgi:hypothetical protein